MPKVKVYFVIYSLAKGGAERVFSVIANGLDKSKFEVTVITITSDYKQLYVLDNDVIHIDLNIKKSLFAVKKLFEIIKTGNPNVVFSTIGQVNIIVGFIGILLKSFFGLKTYFMMRETSIPSINNQKSQYPAWLLTFLIKKIYPRFDLIIAQGKNMKSDLIDNFAIEQTKIHIINNPIEPLNYSISKNENSNINYLKEHVFITVGNLSTIKGYDRLLEVMKRISDTVKFKYYILGSGDQEQIIKQTISEFDLQENCILTGSVNNVQEYLLRADLFIQCSYYEGFPNVLIEANQVGLPVVAFDVPGGTSEIIENGKNGYLVKDGDIDSFVEHIILALNTDFNKKEIITQTNAKFSKSKIIAEYEELFIQVTQNINNGK